MSIILNNNFKSIDTNNISSVETQLEAINNMLSFVQDNTGNIRVNITLGTVTTVSTLTDQTNIGGKPAINIVTNAMDSLAYIGNIQNIAEN